MYVMQLLDAGNAEIVCHENDISQSIPKLFQRTESIYCIHRDLESTLSQPHSFSLLHVHRHDA